MIEPRLCTTCNTLKNIPANRTVCEACRKRAQRAALNLTTPEQQYEARQQIKALEEHLTPKYKPSDWYGDLEEIKDQEYYLTGISEFDAMSGFPKGRLSLVYGPQGVGKSTLMYNVIKTLSEQAKVLYIDSEAGISTERLEELGLSPDNLTIARDMLVEDAYERIMDAVSPTGLETYDLIIVDSLSALTFRAELTNEPESANVGRKAFILNKLCRVLPVSLAKSGCTVIFINQERDRFDGMGKTVPGGMGQLYASSHTIRLSTDAKSKFQRDNQVAGHWVTAEIRKSRVTAPFQKAKFQIFY